MKSGFLLTLFLASANVLACDAVPEAQAAITKDFKILSHSEFSKNVQAVKVGMEAEKILKLLGQPTCRVGKEWNYDSSRLDGFHMPPVGSVVITNASFILNEDKVTTIKLGIVDNGAPASRIPVTSTSVSGTSAISTPAAPVPAAGTAAATPAVSAPATATATPAAGASATPAPAKATPAASTPAPEKK